MPQLNSCVSLELSPLCVFVGGGIYPHDPPIPPVSSCLICVYTLSEQAELMPETGQLGEESQEGDSFFGA